MATVVLFVSSIVLFLRVLKMIQEGKKCDPRLKNPPECKCCPDRFGKRKGYKLQELERIPGPVQVCQRHM